MAGLIVVGCSDDEETSTVLDGPELGGSGDVYVETDPSQLTVPWALTLPGGNTVSGVNNYQLNSQDPGDYTISWPILEGWNEPRPSVLTENMASGSNLVFTAIYLPQPGTTLIGVSPKGLGATWSLSKLGGGFSAEDNNDTTLVNLVPGEYVISWSAEEGYEAPETRSQTLSAISPNFITGSYTIGADSVLINPLPTELNGSWTLVGSKIEDPEFTYSETGTGRQMLLLSEDATYTATWGDVDQFHTPAPQSINVDLESGDSYFFTAEYTPVDGSINIAATVGSTDLPWALTGPSGAVQHGSGTKSMTGMRIGQYILNGTEFDGWVPAPVGSSGDLTSSNTLDLTVVADAAVTVRPMPLGLDATWQLTGPAGYSLDGFGEMLIDGLSTGSYTLTWSAMNGWDVPAPSTQTLATDQGVVFESVFTQGANTLHVNPRPSSEVISWDVTGPGGFASSGVGMETLAITETGTYTVVWGNVAGYMVPSPRSVLFNGEDNVTLSITYVELLDLVGISAGNFTMGSPSNESCRSDFEGQHGVGLTGDFIMKTTEVTNEQYISMAQWAVDNGYATADRFGVNDNIGESHYELLDLDDGDQEIFFENGVFSTSDPNQPVKEVSWYGAVSYCDWLSLYVGLEMSYDHNTWVCGISHPSLASGYRLPTEAEWEYACRAGSNTAFANNVLIYGSIPNCYNSLVSTLAWYNLTSGGWSNDVGLLDANAWGLYDMHGNVREWVNDLMRDAYYFEGPPANDPPGPLVGENRVSRGGYFFSTADRVRSAARHGSDPGSASYDTGFRVVLSDH